MNPSTLAGMLTGIGALLAGIAAMMRARREGQKEGCKKHDKVDTDD